MIFCSIRYAVLMSNCIIILFMTRIFFYQYLIGFNVLLSMFILYYPFSISTQSMTSLLHFIVMELYEHILIGINHTISLSIVIIYLYFSAPYQFMLVFNYNFCLFPFMFRNLISLFYICLFAITVFSLFLSTDLTYLFSMHSIFFIDPILFSMS